MDTRKALCRWLPPQLFEVGSPVQMRQARDICLQCPIRQECYDDAVEFGGGEMIRGGFFFYRDDRKPRVIRSEQRPFVPWTSPVDEDAQEAAVQVGMVSPRHLAYKIGRNCQRQAKASGMTCDDPGCRILAREQETAYNRLRRERKEARERAEASDH